MYGHTFYGKCAISVQWRNFFLNDAKTIDFTFG